MRYKHRYHDLLRHLDEAYAEGQQRARNGDERKSFWTLCEHGRYRDAACLAGYDHAIEEMQRQADSIRRLVQVPLEARLIARKNTDGHTQIIVRWPSGEEHVWVTNPNPEPEEP